MRKIFFIAFIGLFLTTYSCKKENEHDNSKKTTSINGFLPKSITVDIPSSICNSSSTSSLKSTLNDSLSLTGNQLYGMLRVFIYIGKASANYMQAIVSAIDHYKLENVTTLEYTSDQDSLLKVITVTKNVTLLGKTWEYNLIIKDKASGKTGMQVCWNNNPAKAIAIVNPYIINHNDNDGKLQKNSMYKIEYSSAGEIVGYDRYMIISISGLEKDKINNYWANSLKMFVGAKGSVIDIYGNTNHPNCRIIDQSWKDGRNWAFGARSDSGKNIAVAQVALPPCSLNSTDKIFSAYSLDSVLKTECRLAWASFTDTHPLLRDTVNKLINVITKNAKTPAFFNKNGFVSAGTLPIVTPQNPEFSGFTPEFINIEKLMPFVPKEISEQKIEFME